METSTAIQRASILSYPLDLVDFNTAYTIVKCYLQERKQLHLVTLNPEMIINSQNTPSLSEAILSADFLIPDGAGLLLALRLKGKKLSKTIPGIELAEKSIAFCEEQNLPIALLGASEKSLQGAINKIKEKHPSINICYARNGYFSEDENDAIATEVSNVEPALLLVALGIPKQEVWISHYKRLFPNTVMVGVGGSFDVWSGNVRRAPLIFRKLHSEWVFRLLQEPKRYKRIFYALPYFVLQILFRQKGLPIEQNTTLQHC